MVKIDQLFKYGDKFDINYLLRFDETFIYYIDFLYTLKLFCTNLIFYMNKNIFSLYEKGQFE